MKQKRQVFFCNEIIYIMSYTTAFKVHCTQILHTLYVFGNIYPQIEPIHHFITIQVNWIQPSNKTSLPNAQGVSPVATLYHNNTYLLKVFKAFIVAVLSGPSIVQFFENNLL